MRLFILAALAFPAGAAAGTRAPYVPHDPGVVLQKVPSVKDPRVRRFQALRAKLSNRPHDRALALKLSRAYLGYGRGTGDARYLGRALAVIAPWMRHKPQPVPVLLVHATILQSRHHFRASRRELKRVLQRAPGNAQAWLTQATVAMVQGDYRLANHSCVHLARVGGNFMGTMCTAELRSLSGHDRQALTLLRLIEHPGTEAPASIKGYVEGLIADTAKRLGRDKLADRHFRKALQFTPGDNFLLADFGDLLLRQGRPKAALQLVKGYGQSDTSFMRRVFAEAALDSPRAHDDIAVMAARFKAMEQRGSHVYRREQARFVLYLEHDPQRALRLARRNWTVQRAPKDVRVYLEAALAAHKPAAARPVLRFLKRTGMSTRVVDPLAARVRSALAAAPGTAAAAENAP